MLRTASLLLLLAVVFCTSSCALLNVGQRPQPTAGPATPARAISPSPRLLVGRVLAIDPRQQFAFVELSFDPPRAALESGAELTARSMDLRETAQLRVSRYIRGRTLGTTVISGQPSPGDEVVWLAP